MYDKFNDKLPKYWGVKLTKDNEEEFKNTVGKYLTSVYKMPWKCSDINSYYGHDGSSSFKGTGCHVTYSYFSNNPTILTLQEFKSYFEEFKLPEKWCIRGILCGKDTGADNKILKSYFDKYDSDYEISSPDCFYYVEDDVVKRVYSLPEGYTEITFGQFKQYVLKPIEPEFVLPGLWCIKVDADNVQVLTQWVEAHDDFDKDFNDIHGWVINKNMYDHSYQFYADEKPTEYTEITFEQFKKYVLKENNMKKIIGYKLKKEQYLASARSIMGCDPKHNNWPIDVVRPDNTDCDKLKEAGVLDLWFEPVYEEEFKIGDWVTVIDSTKLRSWSNWENAVGYTFQLVEREQKGAFNRWLEGESTPYIAPDNRYRINFHISSVRKATPEEIAKVSVKELNFGIVKFTIKPGQDYAETEYGKVPKKDIKAAIDWIKNAPTLAGFRFTIHNTKSGKYETLEGISTGNIADTMIGFGCRYGKLSELEAIYKAFD